MEREPQPTTQEYDRLLAILGDPNQTKVGFDLEDVSRESQYGQIGIVNEGQQIKVQVRDEETLQWTTYKVSPTEVINDEVRDGSPTLEQLLAEFK